MVDWHKAWEKARKTGRWAVTMTKVRARKVAARTRWHFVTFLGPKHGESVGIIDLVAIRRDHALGQAGLKRGDLFELVLIQVKGGAAPLPSLNEVERLRLVGAVYKAKAILLAQWKPGKQAVFYRLKAGNTAPESARQCWEELPALAEVFH
jgi:hypothetical protein